MKARLVPIIAILLNVHLATAPPTRAQDAPQTTRPPAAPTEKNDAQAAQPSAEEILAKMWNTYAQCKSYRDEGEVVTVYIAAQPTFTDHRPFKTLFVRPKLFRFEFESRSPATRSPRPPRRYVVWADGEQIRSWWTIRPEVKEFDSISRALAGPHGVSGGSATNIPRLLLQSKKPWLKRLENAKLVGEEKIDGAVCHKISASVRGVRDVRIVLWIDKQTSLIRRMFERDKGPTVEETTTYRPQLDVEIPHEEFTFEPPEQ